jgi:hypothetical protein
VLPKKPALPKAKTPPSLAISQYPLPSGEEIISMIGLLSLMWEASPYHLACPNG